MRAFLAAVALSMTVAFILGFAVQIMFCSSPFGLITGVVGFGFSMDVCLTGRNK